MERYIHIPESHYDAFNEVVKSVIRGFLPDTEINISGGIIFTYPKTTKVISYGFETDNETAKNIFDKCTETEIECGKLGAGTSIWSQNIEWDS